MRRFVLATLLMAIGLGVAATAAEQDPPSLTDAEKADLLSMRQEEKLARDVYTALGEKWPKRIFKNIARAEQHHMDAVKVLLDRYDLADPIADKKPGEFADANFAKLYKELVEKGSQSMTEAIRVGVAIEKMDIADLEEAMDNTEREDLLNVYTALHGASHRHLRAFSRHLPAEE